MYMNLQALFLQTILTVAPPGHTKFSVSPVECQGEACSKYQWSTFYNSYVKTESVEEGKLRYAIIIDEMIDTAKLKLCMDDDLNAIPNCTRNKSFKGWKFVDLISITTASMIAESGLRKDVQDGDGWAQKASDDGGMGRGPGGEVCLVQIHPLVLAKFKVDPLSLLGVDGLGTCFGFGMDMFARTRGMCAYKATKTPEIEHNWVFETYSLYGTGNTCVSANNGKTSYRESLYKIIASDFGSRIKKEKRKEAKAANNSLTLPLPPPNHI